MQNQVYFNKETNTWSVVTKRVDMTTYSIIYEQQDGFRTEEEAVSVYNEWMERYKKDIDRIRKIDANYYSFQEYLEYWVKHILPLYSSSKSYNTVANWTIYKFIIPQIMEDIPLAKVTPEYINNLLKTFDDNAKTTAAYSCRKFMLLALKSAINEGLLLHYPFEAVRKIPEPKAKYVKYTKEQLKTLCNTVKDIPSIFPEFLLCLFCGLRTGEVLGLEYSAIDFDRGTITIRQQINRDSYQIDKITGIKVIHPLPPKSESSYRTIKAPDLVMEELKKRQLNNRKYFETHPFATRDYETYVCIGSKGYIKGYGTILSYLKRLCVNIGLPLITPHDLRHLCATILLEAGFPLESISKILGHSSAQTTFNIYCGVISGDEDIRHSIGEKLNPANQYTVHGGQL